MAVTLPALQTVWDTLSARFIYVTTPAHEGSYAEVRFASHHRLSFHSVRANRTLICQHALVYRSLMVQRRLLPLCGHYVVLPYAAQHGCSWNDRLLFCRFICPCDCIKLRLHRSDRKLARSKSA